VKDVPFNLIRTRVTRYKAKDGKERAVLLWTDFLQLLRHYKPKGRSRVVVPILLLVLCGCCSAPYNDHYEANKDLPPTWMDLK
jgi:hypothetical protein